MQAAGMAKGTFYVHFADLAALETELGAALIQELDDRLQAARRAADHPLTRLATAAAMLLTDLAAALRLGSWRVPSPRYPTSARVREHPRQDLTDDMPPASRHGLISSPRVRHGFHRAGGARGWAMVGSTRRQKSEFGAPSCAPGCAPRSGRARRSTARHADPLRRTAAPADAS